MTLKRSYVAALAALPVLIVACSNDDQPTNETTAPGATEVDAAEFPVTIGSGDTAVEIAEQPRSIVSLSPTATEMLFAIDAGDQLVAADEYSTYPDEAPTTDLSGFEPNVEAIAAFQPDLVIAESDPGELVSSLRALDVPTLVLPSAATLDDTYREIEQLGVATGHVGDAAELVAQMQADIDNTLADIPQGEDVTYYHELDANLYTVTSDTFIGQVYGLADMKSIADKAPDAAGVYPQVAPEFIVNENPDIIFFADGGAGGVTAEDIADRPGWDTISAVQNDRIVELDPAISSRWGPRIVDFLRTVVEERSALQPAS